MSSKIVALALLATMELCSGFAVLPNQAGSVSVPQTVLYSSMAINPGQQQPQQAVTAQQPNKVSRRLRGLHRDANVIFSIIDLDGNGFISREELEVHLSKAGYNSQVIAKLFNKLDKNQDESIGEEEFRAGFELLPQLRSAPGMGNYNREFVREIHEDADQAFQAADSNGNGSIDEFELQSHLKRHNYSEAAVEKLFRLLDTHGNRKITKNQFRDAFVRYSALRQAMGQGPNFK